MSQIAVIGMSCRLPGARNVDEYWQLLSQHGEAFVEVPPSRWDWRQYYTVGRTDNAICFNKAGFIPGLEYFDGRFFALDASEAQRMDPQQRIILELIWEALESACIIPGSLSGSDAAVIMGVGHSDHARKLKNDFPTFNGAVGLHSYDCFVANRVSYFLNLKGPSFVVNSACSSSLHAVHLACSMLREEETRLAICGGVNVNLLADESVDSTLARWLTPAGHCRSFSEGGDGFVRSEGAGVVILKLLDDALADGDPVLGVIRGSALSHNGQSNGISVPNGDAQKRLLRRSFAQAGISPGDIDYVEAHGTGSSKGDSTEALSLIEVLGSEDPTRRIRVGCCKPNIGHTEAASGVAGLIKVLLCLKHGQLPRISNLEKLNRWIPDHPAFSPLWQDEPWVRGEWPRRAGLANYAFGGANTFFIIEEYERQAAPSRPLSQRFAFISAKSEAVLERLSSALTASMPRLTQDELYTLNCCREQHGCRSVLLEQDSGRIVHYRQHLSDVSEHKVLLRLDAQALVRLAPSLIDYVQRSAYLGHPLGEFAQLTGISPVDVAPDRQQVSRYLAAFWGWLCRRARIALSLIVTSPELASASLVQTSNAASEDVRLWILHGGTMSDAAHLQHARRKGSLVNIASFDPQDGGFNGFDLCSIWAEVGRLDIGEVTPEHCAGADSRLLDKLVGFYLAGHSVQLAVFLRGNKVSMSPLDPFARDFAWFTPSVRIVPKYSLEEPAHV